jgi:lipoate-protein ligase A
VNGWQIDRQRGSAREFHTLDPNPVDRRTAWIFEVDAPALALGSSQPESDVERTVADRLGIDVFRRHSGGGAVMMSPGSCVWIDIVLPIDDPLWAPDVSMAPLWLGEVWASALAGVGAIDPTVHRGAMVRPPMAGVVCFAGLAPGEVSCAGKTVGISQRRTRSVARFQTIALLEWDRQLHETLLAPGISRLLGAAGETTGEEVLGDSWFVDPLIGVDTDELIESFVRVLDHLG